jgi:hypothetical protein
MVRLFRGRFVAVSVVILLVLIVLSDLSPQAEGQLLGGLILEPQLVNIMQGYGFNIDVTFQDVTNLVWFNFHLDFDTSKISMQTYAYHDGWSGGCGPESGGLVCSATPTGDPFTGSTVVVTITFRCEDTGSSQISPSSSSDWAEAPYGSVFHNFAVIQGATVNQAAPLTVTSTVTNTTTTTTTTSSVSTTLSETTSVVTSYGYVTRSGTTTTTSLVTSVLTSEFTSVFTSVLTSVVTSVFTSLSTTGSLTVTTTLTSMGTTTIRTTNTVIRATTVASPTTMTVTTTNVQPYVPPNPTTRCVIATAAYGSELAPEVVYMRHVRDDLIGSSSLGKTLVTGFNEFYYSWSPALADWIGESAFLRAAFRILLLPLVMIAHVAALVFTSTACAAGQTDAASLLGFLAAAIMTVTVYVLLPVMVVVRSRPAIRGLRARFRSQLRGLDHVG